MSAPFNEELPSTSAKAAVRKERKGREAARIAMHDAPTCAVLVLAAHDGPVLGKSYSRDEISGAIVKGKAGMTGRFSATEYLVGDIYSLASVFDLIARGEAGNAIAIRGAAHDLADARRLGRSKRWKEWINPETGEVRHLPPGTKDIARYWKLLDMDGVPNVLKIDPRRDPERAARFVMSCLPRTIACATVGFAWSSSLCIGLPDGIPPKTLRCHILVWLSIPLAEAEACALLKEINLASRALVHAAGAEISDIPDNMVDFRTAVFQQPLYCLMPRLDGVTDPFPGCRRFMLEGDIKEVDVAALRAELETAEMMAIMRETNRITRIVSPTKGKPGKVEVVWEPLPPLSKGRKRNAMITGFIRRLNEIEVLLRDRALRDPEWSCVPDGFRNHVCNMVTDAFLALWQLGQIKTSDEAVAAAVHFLEFKSTLSGTWLEERMPAITGDARMRAASPSIHFRRARTVIRRLRISTEEMKALRFRHLLNDTVKSAQHRSRAKVEKETLVGTARSILCGNTAIPALYRRPGETRRQWLDRTRDLRAAVKDITKEALRLKIEAKTGDTGEDLRARRMSQVVRWSQDAAWDLGRKPAKPQRGRGRPKSVVKLEPWKVLGLSKAAYYRRKAAGTLPALQETPCDAQPAPVSGGVVFESEGDRRCRVVWMAVDAKDAPDLRAALRILSEIDGREYDPEAFDREAWLAEANELIPF